MFNAKIKAATVLCGLAALVQFMGVLLLRTHAVAAQRARAEAEEALLRQEAANIRKELGLNLEKPLDQLTELRAAAREKFNAERQELRYRRQ